MAGEDGAYRFAVNPIDKTNGIKTIETESNGNDSWYTLSGVNVQKPSKGIYIWKGKKALVK